jgi:hypothetical protein
LRNLFNTFADQPVKLFYSAYEQGCQMVHFQTRDLNLGKFWRALEWKMLLHVFYGHTYGHTNGLYITVIRYILWTLCHLGIEKSNQYIEGTYIVACD